MLAVPGSEIRERLFESPASRTSFVVAFHTPEREKTIIFPDYSFHLSSVAAGMSVLFGKKLDVHGLTEHHGRFLTPDVSQYASLCDPRLRFNSHQPRNAYPVKLVLDEFGAIRPLFESDEGAATKLIAAARFYMRSLQSAERDAEVAYLHLITAGEVLANLFEYPDSVRLSDEIRSDLALVKKHVPQGCAVVRRLSSVLWGVRRSFVRALTSLLDSDFYESCDDPPHYRLEQENIEKHIGAAYDLRSLYLHTGEPFRTAISTGYVQSFIPGELDSSNKNLRKASRDAPTLIGLERLIRYAILKCMENHEFLGPRSAVEEG
ncbi:MAG: hypothetical protein OXG83_15620 [Acidobacteria bacterium]|nr:hypothetical protein [Acidobacteriota bacterium]